MPSPPDVVLVLSPRMARLVVHLMPSGIMYEEAEAGGYTSTDEAAKALDAFCAEVEAQLARTPVRDRAADEDVLPIADLSQTPAAEVADKMAKSARKAVESNDTDTADGLGSGGLVTDEDRAELEAEGDRSPGVAPPDSEVQ